ncbi:hypothetical protein PV779_42895 [Streptomyces sp. ID01-9D]|nr:hypothetical protein [Streptomyces sp. ID01-9D]
MGALPVAVGDGEETTGGTGDHHDSTEAATARTPAPSSGRVGYR